MTPTESEGAAKLNTSKSAPPSLPTTANKKTPGTQMWGDWGCIFSLRYIGDSEIPPKTQKQKTQKTDLHKDPDAACILVAVQDEPRHWVNLRDTPGVTKASQESLLKYLSIYGQGSFICSVSISALTPLMWQLWVTGLCLRGANQDLKPGNQAKGQGCSSVSERLFNRRWPYWF